MTAAGFVGLEVWAIGTAEEIRAAMKVLADAGHVAEQSPPVALTGRDTGRYRCYARIAVTYRLAAPSRPGDTAFYDAA